MTEANPSSELITKEFDDEEQLFLIPMGQTISEIHSDNDNYSSDDVPLFTLATNSWSKIHCSSIKCSDFEYVGVKGRLKDEGKDMSPHEFL